MCMGGESEIEGKITQVKWRTNEERLFSPLLNGGHAVYKARLLDKRRGKKGRE